MTDDVSTANTDRWGRWLTLAANVGVLLGLFVLILEVRQNAALTRAAMEQDKNNLLAEIELSLAKPEMAEVWMKSVAAPETLTDPEIRMVEGHLVAMMLQSDQRLQIMRSGLISRDEARQHLSNMIPFYFGSRFGKNFWRLQAMGWQGTAMMEMGDPINAQTDETFMRDYYAQLRIQAEPQQDVPE